LSLCFSSVPRHEGVLGAEVQLHAFLTSALGGGVQLHAQAALPLGYEALISFE